SSNSAHVERRFLEIVTPHASRWRSIILTRNDDYHGKLFPTHIINQHFPRLEEFRSFSYRVFPEKFPGLSAPSLRRLRFPDDPFPLRLEANLLSKLTYIAFEAKINDAPFRSQDYHILFSSAPYLSSIHIFRSNESSESPLWFGIGVNVELLFLKEFALYDLSWVDMYALMQFIVIGHDNNPSIRIECGEDTDYTLPTSTILLGGGPQRSLWNQPSIMTTLTHSIGLNAWYKTGGYNKDRPDLSINYRFETCSLLWMVLEYSGFDPIRIK
ncbi:hypothetical protein FRC02_005586, partial [Tulasnella sp. 418]